MKMPPKKQISMLLVSLLIPLGLSYRLGFLNANGNQTFPDCQIKEISDLGECSNNIFEIVADRMGLEINENLPKPIILTDTQITRQKFSSYLGWDAKEVTPYYFSRQNTVVIPLNCKLDSLAHELVHYFQVMYRNENLSPECGPYIDILEMEAVAIQRWFKVEYLGANKPDHRIAGRTTWSANR